MNIEKYKISNTDVKKKKKKPNVNNRIETIDITDKMRKRLFTGRPGTQCTASYIYSEFSTCIGDEWQ